MGNPDLLADAPRLKAEFPEAYNTTISLLYGEYERLNQLKDMFMTMDEVDLKDA